MSHLLKNEHFTVRLTVRGRGGQPPWPIRKASLFAVGRKRDSEEIVLLKNGGFGGRAYSSKMKRDIGMGLMGKMMPTYRATNVLLTNSDCGAVLTVFCLPKVGRCR